MELQIHANSYGIAQNSYSRFWSPVHEQAIFSLAVPICFTQSEHMLIISSFNQVLRKVNKVKVLNLFQNKNTKIQALSCNG